MRPMRWTAGKGESTFGPMSLRLLHVVVCSCFVACDAAPPRSEPASSDPPAAAPVRAASPLGQLEPPSATTREVSGVVAERLAAGTYSYLRVEADGRSTWI